MQLLGPVWIEGHKETDLTEYIFIDIDECQENTYNCICESGLAASGCTPVCINTNGSYNCSCSVGFEIGSNSSVCVGMYVYIIVDFTESDIAT